MRFPKNDVIKSMECCKVHNADCDRCSYNKYKNSENAYCSDLLMQDAVTLLKSGAAADS